MRPLPGRRMGVCIAVGKTAVVFFLCIGKRKGFRSLVHDPVSHYCALRSMDKAQYPPDATISFICCLLVFSERKKACGGL